MSAFICSDRLFRVLGLFAAQREGFAGAPRVDPRYVDHHDLPAKMKLFACDLTRDLAEAYANILRAQNVRSVAKRYPREEFDDDTIKIKNENEPIPALVELLKALDCWEYQSCETDDCRSTFAWALADEMRRAIIKELPGYDKAPWGIQ